VNSFLHNLHHLILPLLLLNASGALAERTFKWVDEEGNVHYGDKIPLQYSTRERKEINEQGRTLKIYEPPRTEEEKAEQERLAAIDAEKKQRNEEQERYDSILLATYSSEADMQMAHDGKLAAIEELIQLTSSRHNSLQKRLTVLTEDTADYQRRNKPVPEFVQHQTGTVRDQISQTEAYIETKQLEMEAISQQFATDIARYHELQDSQ
jgi:hypothetical protein